MESNFFLMITAGSAILSALSFFIKKLRIPKETHIQKYEHLQLKRIHFSPVFVSITLTILFGLLVSSVSNQLNVVIPRLEITSEKIAILEHQIYELESKMSSLEEENQILKSESIISNYMTHFITFDTSGSDYSGSITPLFSFDGNVETVSIILSPAEGYSIECIDSSNNLIKTFLKNNDTWFFAMPDSNVTVLIKNE